MNRALLLSAGLTLNEIQLLELGRELKTRTGHGTLTVEYRNGREAQMVPAPKVTPVDLPARC